VVWSCELQFSTEINIRARIKFVHRRQEKCWPSWETEGCIRPRWVQGTETQLIRDYDVAALMELNTKWESIEKRKLLNNGLRPNILISWNHGSREWMDDMHSMVDWICMKQDMSTGWLINCYLIWLHFMVLMFLILWDKQWKQTSHYRVADTNLMLQVVLLEEIHVIVNCSCSVREISVSYGSEFEDNFLPGCCSV
jgi:hypothetical protein